MCSNVVWGSQQDTIKQYTNNGGPCNKKNAQYYRIAVKSDSIWYCNEYYLRGLTIKTEGQYTDAGLTRKIGKFVDYYFGGKLKAVRYYLDNKVNGTELKYSRNGRLTDSSLYLDDIPTEFSYGWYDDGRVKRRSIYSSDGQGTGNETEYYEDGSLSSFGIFCSGHKKDSVWTYFYRNGKPSYREYFDKGRLTKRECYTSSGERTEDCDSFKSPEPGYDIYQYIANSTSYVKADDLLKGKECDILVVFRIYEDGSIHDAEVVEEQYPLLSKAAIEVIKNMPDWKSACIDHNRRVRTSYMVVVPFYGK